MKMERYKFCAGEEGWEAVALVLDGPGKGFRPSQSPCGVGLGDALQLPEEDVAGAMRVL